MTEPKDQFSANQQNIKNSSFTNQQTTTKMKLKDLQQDSAKLLIVILRYVIGKYTWNITLYLYKNEMYILRVDKLLKIRCH